MSNDKTGATDEVKIVLTKADGTVVTVDTSASSKEKK